MQCFTTLEAEYEAAKLRLHAAQQEKLEATADFLAIRTVLRQNLEAFWPEVCLCTQNAGYNRDTYEQRKDLMAVK